MVGGERLRRHDHFVEVALHQLRDHVAEGRLQENTGSSIIVINWALEGRCDAEPEELWKLLYVLIFNPLKPKTTSLIRPDVSTLTAF